MQHSTYDNTMEGSASPAESASSKGLHKNTPVSAATNADEHGENRPALTLKTLLQSIQRLEQRRQKDDQHHHQPEHASPAVDITPDMQESKDNKNKQETPPKGSNRINLERCKRRRSRRIIFPTFSNPLPSETRPRPHIRRCNWRELKNISLRAGVDEEPCVADVLIAGEDLPLQVIDDATQRSGDERGSEDGDSEASEDDCDERFHGPDGNPEATLPQYNDDLGVIEELIDEGTDDLDRPEVWIHRVRIRAASVLCLLRAVSGTEWNVSLAHTFMRPFVCLIIHHEKVRESLAHLETEAAGDPSETETDSAKAILQQVRCYVDFVDRYLLPSYQRFEGKTDGNLTIRFDDLWYLFRPGELVYQDSSSAAMATLRGAQALQSHTRQRIFRVIYSNPHIPQITGEGLYRGAHRCMKVEKSDAVGDRGDDGLELFELRYYFLDYNGDCFVPSFQIISMRPFSGRVTIRSLIAYPVRFAESPDQLETEWRAQGQKFLECLRVKHLFCNGCGLLMEPTGEEVSSPIGDRWKVADRYIGEVYVDMKEAIRSQPYWAMRKQGFAISKSPPNVIVETYSILVKTGNRERRVREMVVLNDNATEWQVKVQLDTDPYFGPRNSVQLELMPLRDDDLALLSRRVYAFLMRYRFFVPVDTRDLEPIPPNRQALEQMEIAKDMKNMLCAVVSNHFEHRTPLVSTNIKGRGLVVLLQGPPGTGKTATAEAIAQVYEKPLFTIDMEDLVSEVDGPRRLLDLAATWDCVVLIDEVDVFLTRRERHDVRANLQVSILLNILETFPGLMFLTTCRPAVLDEGVKSRVHVNLCFEPLSLKQTLAIFKLSISQLKANDKQIAVFDKEILQFARRQYKSNTVSVGRWNGRQIRNAFRVAVALARYQVLDQEKPGEYWQPQLHAHHFEDVAKLTTRYDEARKDALLKDDSTIAAELRERCDVMRTGGTGSKSWGKVACYREESAADGAGEARRGVNPREEAGGDSGAVTSCSEDEQSDDDLAEVKSHGQWRSKRSKKGLGPMSGVKEMYHSHGGTRGRSGDESNSDGANIRSRGQIRHR